MMVCAANKWFTLDFLVASCCFLGRFDPEPPNTSVSTRQSLPGTDQSCAAGAKVSVSVPSCVAGRSSACGEWIPTCGPLSYRSYLPLAVQKHVMVLGLDDHTEVRLSPCHFQIAYTESRNQPQTVFILKAIAATNRQWHVVLSFLANKNGSRS